METKQSTIAAKELLDKIMFATAEADWAVEGLVLLLDLVTEQEHIVDAKDLAGELQTHLYLRTQNHAKHFRKFKIKTKRRESWKSEEGNVR